MSKSKIRLIFNIFVGVLFLVFLYLIVISETVSPMWSMGFVITVTIIKIIRDKVAPKKKKNKDEDNN
ncbi:hypothetical protein FH144_01735 [Staphylococcus caledonicus]|uniref:hypothetical protein n=1 Tax=Staphylococcus sp. acrmy TaxID=2929076 RepID=UPI001F59E784|nr:hypothetical protein [Staphylococcus sp. acrmy]MCI2947150.1 hypothetical protein [Staphylococcus sp. acrmy]